MPFLAHGGQCNMVAGLDCMHLNVECDSGFRMQNHTFFFVAVMKERLFVSLGFINQLMLVE